MRPSQISTFLENFTRRRPLHPASAQTISQLRRRLRPSSHAASVPAPAVANVVAPVQELLAAHTESGPWTDDDDGRRRLRQGVEGDYYERTTQDEYGRIVNGLRTICVLLMYCCTMMKI